MYGVEKYLNQCIESLVNQTYKNIEIILVDDGSKDRCPEIIDDWLGKDKRIRTIHKKNGGQSSARNVGMDLAEGQYITFVDSDDWVEPDYCEKLYRAANMYEADIAVASFKRMIGDKEYPADFFIPSENVYYPCSIDHAVKYFLEYSVAVWGKMYKAEVLKDIRFPEGRLAEEYAFQLKTLMRSKLVVFCNAHLYSYRIRMDSAAHSIKPKYLLDCVQALDEAYWMCKEHFYFEIDFCKKRLSSLLYEFTAAEVFGKDIAKVHPNVLEHALETVGGKEKLLDKMETPMTTIFYAYTQFYEHFSGDEKIKLQRDYREKFTLGAITQYKKLFWVKYFPAYFSLELTRKFSKVYASMMPN